MLYQVMKYIRNFFVLKSYDGTFTIKDGSIDLSFLQSGQYFLVEGSVFNDGVYQYSEGLELTDETFTGRICALNPDKEFLALVDEMVSSLAINNTSFVSESFGGYSYTRATNGAGIPITVLEQYKNRLKPWRKL